MHADVLVRAVLAIVMIDHRHGNRRDPRAVGRVGAVRNCSVVPKKMPAGAEFGWVRRVAADETIFRPGEVIRK